MVAVTPPDDAAREAHTICAGFGGARFVTPVAAALRERDERIKLLQNESVPMLYGEPMICEEHFWLLWPHDACAGPGMQLKAASGYRDKIATLTTRVEALERAIRWALGEGDSDFGDHIHPHREPRYCWRTDNQFPPNPHKPSPPLRKRAAR